jgi:hypothetical protein
LDIRLTRFQFFSKAVFADIRLYPEVRLYFSPRLLFAGIRFFGGLVFIQSGGNLKRRAGYGIRWWTFFFAGGSFICLFVG